MKTQTIFKTIAFILTAILFTFGSIGCATNAATGRLQFNSMSRDREITLGTEALPQLTKEYGGEVHDPVLRDYVTKVGMKLTQDTEGDNPDLPWEFTLLDSDVINAFALPGGKVFITRALLDRMSNEAQLAGVLGHEIGHVTAQHTDDRIGQSYLVTFGAALAGIATKDSDNAWTQKVMPLVVDVGGQGYLLHFSRGQEEEADYLGMRYMRRADYNPAAQLQVMKILQQSQRESGGGKGLEFFSTHPYPETRIKNIKKWLAADFEKTQNNPQYGFYEEPFKKIVRPRLDAIDRKK